MGETRAPVSVELHRFRQQLYLTGGRMSTWGAAVGQRASARQVGRRVLSGLAAQRASAGSWLTSMHELRRRELEHRAGWARFCRNVVGVTPAQYQPEIRVQVLDMPDGVLVVRPAGAGARPDRQAEVRIPANSKATLVGETVLDLLRSTPPRWPVIGSATLTTVAGGGLALSPDRAVVADSVRLLPLEIGVVELAAAIRAALDADIAARADPPAVEYAGTWMAGVDKRDLAGGAMVSIEEKSDGILAVRADSWVHGLWQPDKSSEHAIADRDTAAAARTARHLIGRMPTRHRNPGQPTGTAFGYKSAWFAVRGHDHAAVAAALALDGCRHVSWDEGVAAAYRQGVFVTPSTGGWILVVGNWPSRRRPDVAELSARLDTEVQNYASHRIVGYYRWELATGGALRRGVVVESAEVTQVGAATDVERGLWPPDITDDDLVDLIDEATPMTVAAEWSVDPRDLEVTPTSDDTGILGHPPR